MGFPVYWKFASPDSLGFKSAFGGFYQLHAGSYVLVCRTQVVVIVQSHCPIFLQQGILLGKYGLNTQIKKVIKYRMSSCLLIDFDTIKQDI